MVLYIYKRKTDSSVRNGQWVLTSNSQKRKCKKAEIIVIQERGKFNNNLIFPTQWINTIYKRHYFQPEGGERRTRLVATAGGDENCYSILKYWYIPKCYIPCPFPQELHYLKIYPITIKGTGISEYLCKNTFETFLACQHKTWKIV